MKWFEGSIPEAIALAKSKQQLFLVFIEGNDELSKAMGTTYEDAAVSSKLQSSRCVAIKLQAGSEPCQQFSQIYPVVVVPSSFFIGCNGIPLEVIAGSVEPPELLNRIDKLFQEPSCVGDNGSLPAEVSLDPAPSPLQAETVPSTEATLPDAPSLEERVERAKRLVEERRLQKIKEEEEAVRQSEMERRRVARELQMAQQSREEQQRREWARQRAQEKEEERRHRERIQAQIAQDRADRAEKYQKEKAQEEQRKRERETQRLLEQQQRAAQEAAARSQVSRIQFRLPDGSSATHTFDADSTLQDLHNYVVETVQPSFSNFTLSTTFPRREFTQEQYLSSLRELELAPSAVILVVPVSTPSVVVPAAVSKSGASLMNLLWSLLTPFGVIWSLFMGLIFGSPDPPVSATDSTSGPSAQRNDQASFGSQEQQAQGGARRRRTAAQPQGEGVYQREGNVYRFSNQRFSDEDDDTNTWNGNSTQQM